MDSRPLYHTIRAMDFQGFFNVKHSPIISLQLASPCLIIRKRRAHSLQRVAWRFCQATQCCSITLRLPESEGHILMNMGTTLRFNMPQGWTLRKVATALAREWLPPFRAVPVVKRAPWMLQPIVDEQGDTVAPLWEPGITTEEYEKRLDRNGLSWSIRAKAGRSHGSILARLTVSTDQATTFDLVCSQDSFPESLFDAEKLASFTANGGQADELFPRLLIENGFQLASA